MVDLRDLHAWLQLGEDVELEVVARVPPPDDAVGRGFVATAASSGLTDVLRRQVMDEPHFGVDAGLSAALGRPVERWEGDPAVVSLPDASKVQRLAGAVANLLGRWLLDTRSSGGAVLLADDGEQLVLASVNGEVTVHRVRAVASLPSPDMLIGELEVPDWFRSRADEWFQGDTRLNQVASVGLVGRLATALSTNSRAALQALLAGATSPADRAGDAAHALSKETMEYVVADAMRLASSLQERASEIPTDEISATAGALWLEVSLDRERLECVRWVLLLQGSDALGPILDELDRRVAMHLSVIFANASNIEDEHLRAVGWQEPHHWWGRSE